MLFKPGERVRYEGQDRDKFGLKAGMEGEVVRCFRDSVDVYYKDLQRLVHFKDFHMRTSLKRMPPEDTKEKESRSPRKIMRLIAWVVLILVIAMIMISILKLEFSEPLKSQLLKLL